MSRADELLRKYFAARDEDARFVGPTHRLAQAEANCRAYLNEKPHEPTGHGVSGWYPDSETNRQGLAAEAIQRASPPHAAAEPEKPMADYDTKNDPSQRAFRDEVERLVNAPLRAMSKADYWLRIYFHAHATGNSVPPNIEADARAYLNEKPHDAGGDCQGAQSVPSVTDSSRPVSPASPPHAAAEPEKPVAWMYESEHSCLGPFTERRVRFSLDRDAAVQAKYIETPLYASPSAQPREPTMRKEMYADLAQLLFVQIKRDEGYRYLSAQTKADIDGAIDQANDDYRDALKSAGKE